MVSCSKHDPKSIWIDDPSLLVEVLSPSTERIDRTEKLLAYTQLPSLQHYLLVAQDQTRIEVLSREANWKPRVYGPGETIAVPSHSTSCTRTRNARTSSSSTSEHRERMSGIQNKKPRASATEALQPPNSAAYKSFQSGFAASINPILRARPYFLICFSRAIASGIVSNISKQTRM